MFYLVYSKGDWLPRYMYIYYCEKIMFEIAAIVSMETYLDFEGFAISFSTDKRPG